MPRTKNPAKYPETYRPMLLSAYARKDAGLRIPCNTASEAHALRRNLYAFVAAVEHYEDQHNMPDDMRDSIRMHQVRITIESGPALLLLNRNYTPENIALTLALESLDPAEVHTEADLAQRDLAERIIAAAEAGDFDEVERLEALAAGEPGDRPPEPTSDFDRFLTKPSE